MVAAAIGLPSGTSNYCHPPMDPIEP